MTVVLIVGAAIFCIVGISAPIWLCVRQLHAIEGQLDAILTELTNLRLGSRARVGEVRYGGNPHDRVEHELQRLGRDSKTKRVVVGGEPDSEQSHLLGRRAEEA